jgi:hypothetical protein
MVNKIIDEFTNLPISRQRKYQLRMERDKRCTISGAPGAVGARCVKHLVQGRELRRRLHEWKRRYRGSLSYKLQRLG